MAEGYIIKAALLLGAIGAAIGMWAPLGYLPPAGHLPPGLTLEGAIVAEHLIGAIFKAALLGAIGAAIGMWDWFIALALFATIWLLAGLALLTDIFRAGWTTVLKWKWAIGLHIAAGMLIAAGFWWEERQRKEKEEAQRRAVDRQREEDAR